MLDRVIGIRGRPLALRCDNGSEFTVGIFSPGVMKTVFS
jgi:hypothetical protein